MGRVQVFEVDQWVGSEYEKTWPEPGLLPFLLLTILDAFSFHLVMYSENVSPTPYLVISKSLKVTSIIVLKMN